MFVRSLCLALFVTLNAFAHAEDSCLGQKVMPKKYGCRINFGDTIDDEQGFSRLKAMVFPVWAEGKDWLRIRDPGANDREGYVAKADFVLLADAPAFYTDSIRQGADNGFGLYYRAVAWRENGELDKSIEDCDELIRRHPTSATPLFYRAEVWTIRKDYGRAIKDYDRAIRLDPELVGAYDNRGLLFAKKKNYDRAIKDFGEAIRLAPETVHATNNLAYLLATAQDDKVRNLSKAQELLKTVLKLRRESPYNDELLSVIAGAQGRFDDAIRLQKQALEDKDYAKNHGDEAKKRLKAYERKKPWRE